MNDIGKRMPYRESDEYLNGMIDQAIEHAINQYALTRNKKHWGRVLASAAAVALLLIGIGMTVFNHLSNPPATVLQNEGPIDEFLSSLTDEEVVQLPYYEIEEIPEY